MKTFVQNVFSLRQGVPEGGQREPFLDFLRGATMLLVLLGHSGFPGNGYILLFHMPLFFLLSGYLKFLQRGKTPLPFFQYVKKQFLYLMVPNYAFELLNYILWCAMCIATGKPVPIGSAMVNILLCAKITTYGGLTGRLWFLPCMFVSNLLCYWLLRWIRTKTGKLAATSVLLLLSWATIRFLPFRMPLQLDAAMMATAFIMAGYLVGEIKPATIKPLWQGALFILSVTCVWLARENGASLLMFENQCGPFLLVLLAALAGSLAFTVLCKWTFAAVQRVTVLYRLIYWYGANSLAAYPIHIEIKCSTYLGIVFLSTQYWYILFPFLVFTTVPAVNIVSVYFPFLLGKSRKR